MLEHSAICCKYTLKHSVNFWKYTLMYGAICCQRIHQRLLEMHLVRRFTTHISAAKDQDETHSLKSVSIVCSSYTKPGVLSPRYLSRCVASRQLFMPRLSDARGAKSDQSSSSEKQPFTKYLDQGGSSNPRLSDPCCKAWLRKERETGLNASALI